MKKQFIAVEGPIGVGKSSLAHKLSQTYKYYEEKEIITENPFLSDFYEDISKWSFQTEMFFLCNRYKQFQISVVKAVLSVITIFIKIKILQIIP